MRTVPARCWPGALHNDGHDQEGRSGLRATDANGAERESSDDPVRQRGVRKNAVVVGAGRVMASRPPVTWPVELTRAVSPEPSHEQVP